MSDGTQLAPHRYQWGAFAQLAQDVIQERKGVRIYPAESVERPDFAVAAVVLEDGRVVVAKAPDVPALNKLLRQFPHEERVPGMTFFGHDPARNVKERAVRDKAKQKAEAERG